MTSALGLSGKTRLLCVDISKTTKQGVSGEQFLSDKGLILFLPSSILTNNFRS